jgi:nitronate monooxygenase
MLSTRFTDLVGCTVPIQQAPIGGCANPRLAAAVAEAGGLGWCR